MRPEVGVADIFRCHGPAYRQAHADHLSGTERRVMVAIEACRTPALGGHAEHCADCDFVRYAYNSCRDRHCPKCQGLVRAEWLGARQAELLPVPYFHVVFTVPAAVADIAFHNKAVVYGILFHAAAAPLHDVAADERDLGTEIGAEIGAVVVLHTWGQALHHYPHLHCIVPGGGLSLDQTRWIACPPGFFLPVRMLSRRFRDLFVHHLRAAFATNELRFPGALAALADPAVFAARLAELAGIDWVVYAKPPFAGPEQVLGYLGRYTHRVAIANSRLVGFGNGQVSFTWKDCRHGSQTKVMTLDADEFIRHIGFLANCHRTEKLALCRTLLAVPRPEPESPGPVRWQDRLRELTGQDVELCPCLCSRSRDTRAESVTSSRDLLRADSGRVSMLRPGCRPLRRPPAAVWVLESRSFSADHPVRR